MIRIFPTEFMDKIEKVVKLKVIKLKVKKTIRFSG